ncbi:hypothetical protein HIM_08330 [Hirsutella minnesotensis 3608]|uniref:C2 domain-containing protein n=1 Tax=Hirsutella minnesotensis 3608 TaxID=1043627 RepID=A0A0F8A3R5_9HYPO|nr:hypothetical protein HIM_08330 [Hirsutella minnesotensis 3608]
MAEAAPASTGAPPVEATPSPESNPQQPAPTQQNGSASQRRASRQLSGLKRSIRLKKGPPGGYDPTPLPDAPQGFTVRFCFRGAANLPPADLNTRSSDPYLTATLKASNPKRNKDDPDLFHRTRTIRRTTEPEWNDEWIVANVPPSGFTLKCRLYDEDTRDSDDRLGNVTVRVPQLFDNWDGIPPPGKEFGAKRRMISKRAILLKSLLTLLSSDSSITPRLTISMELLGPSDPPHAQMYTVGPTTWVKHFSPVIGRLVGTKVNADEEKDGERSDQKDEAASKDKPDPKKGKPKSQKYDFQAIEMQLQGPVPPNLYHRYVEFRPFVAPMFSSTGLRGKVLNTALRTQHDRVYHYDDLTEYGIFEPCSKQAALQFLKLAHFDDGGRLFTYVLTLDGLLRFTETGKEFGIDLLSKHTMHSNVARYIACSGEFFVRRLQHPDASDDVNPKEKTHPSDEFAGGPPLDDPPKNPAYYQLIIDNDSGTYRPDKSVLPNLKKFLEKNLPGLGVITMHCEDEELQKLKEDQRNIKKKEGRIINVVMNGSQSSISSAESELDRRDGVWETGKKSKREAAFAAVEDPHTLKKAVGSVLPHGKKPHGKQGESSG